MLEDKQPGEQSLQVQDLKLEMGLGKKTYPPQVTTQIGYHHPQSKFLNHIVGIPPVEHALCYTTNLQPDSKRYSEPKPNPQMFAPGKISSMALAHWFQNSPGRSRPAWHKIDSCHPVTS